MDEDEYREAYAELNTLPCAFQKALLARRCGCRHEERINIAEREAVGCLDSGARRACVALRAGLRQAGQFAVKHVDPRRALPHPKELKLQCGGLLGLAALIDGQALVPDICGLIEVATARYGGLDELPYGALVQAIAAFEPRPQRHPKSVR